MNDADDPGPAEDLVDIATNLLRRLEGDAAAFAAFEDRPCDFGFGPFDGGEDAGYAHGFIGGLVGDDPAAIAEKLPLARQRAEFRPSLAAWDRSTDVVRTFGAAEFRVGIEIGLLRRAQAQTPGFELGDGHGGGHASASGAGWR